jgi:hypothetical protein
VLFSQCIGLKFRNGAINYKLVMKVVNTEVLFNNNSIALIILSFASSYHGGHNFILKM